MEKKAINNPQPLTQKERKIKRLEAKIRKQSREINSLIIYQDQLEAIVSEYRGMMRDMRIERQREREYNLELDMRKLGHKGNHIHAYELLKLSNKPNVTNLLVYMLPPSLN